MNTTDTPTTEQQLEALERVLQSYASHLRGLARQAGGYGMRDDAVYLSHRAAELWATAQVAMWLRTGGARVSGPATIVGPDVSDYVLRRLGRCASAAVEAAVLDVVSYETNRPTGGVVC